MTKPKHLPECFNGRQRSGGLPCICDRLRACEQRVNGHRLSYENGVEVGYDKGYVAGLDAARDALDVLDRWGDESYRHIVIDFGDAIAAIYALREAS